MPELPEVETTRRALAPYVVGHTINSVNIRQPSLRWPIDEINMQRLIVGSSIRELGRRAKYILMFTDRASLILHLGMSGSLRIESQHASWRKHDHFEIFLSNQISVRYQDPRRFGFCLIEQGNPYRHPMLARLGPEPLTDEFSATKFYKKLKCKKSNIKAALMDSKIVVGVGNIYANEALFRAGISPLRKANNISYHRIEGLVEATKNVLNAALQRGGTTLRDFVHGKGEPGYFAVELNVYGRAGEACNRCSRIIKVKTTNQRSTFYCSHCQT